MTAGGLKVLHLAPRLRTTGGIETLLARHAVHDAGAGFDAWQVSLFDAKPARPIERFSAQQFSWKSTPAAMRRAMARTCGQSPGSVVVYHGVWGVPWFGDNDASSRRIFFFHDSIAHHSPVIPSLVGLADGVICSSGSTADEIRELMPELASNRVVASSYPVKFSENFIAGRNAARPWVIGCCSRMEYVQKRVDRLIPFVRELRRMGLNLRIEVIGEGSFRKKLERKLAADANVHFSGWQTKEEFWRRLGNWDLMVCFSDHEGGPIALLEAMAAGVIPLYPKIGGSLGDDYTPLVDPRCHYPAGDPIEAAKRVESLMSASPAEVENMRARAREAVRSHLVDSRYEETFAAFVRRIAQLPRISKPPLGDRKPRLTDHLPLGLITRCLPGAMLR